jgi:protein-tyrosine kinase
MARHCLFQLASKRPRADPGIDTGIRLIMAANSVTDIPIIPRDHSRAIGGILVEQGVLTAGDVDQIKGFASERSLLFGDAAIQMKLLQQHEVDFALAQQFNYPILARGGDGGVADDVIAAYNPHCSVVESLRALRSRLTLRWQSSSSRKVLAVVSPERGDGRSWLAANLATVFAQNGDRTLLIDANMRNPRQHELFNLSNAVGLSALLTGRAGREAVVHRVHSQLRLFVLPAGTKPPNPQELLGRPVFDFVLNRFAEQFETVIIDTPAAADTADAQILAARAGAAIMLAHRNATRHSRLSAAMEGFSQSSVNIIGSVIAEYRSNR